MRVVFVKIALFFIFEADGSHTNVCVSKIEAYEQLLPQ
jgi:hypothetical protein